MEVYLDLNTCVEISYSYYHYLNLISLYSLLQKKFREAFSSKPWSGKRNNEQVAELSEQKGNGVGLSRETNKYESLDVGFSESDWEII